MTLTVSERRTGEFGESSEAGSGRTEDRERTGGHDWHGLIHIFNDLFRERFRTVLVRGEDEPLYLPRTSAFPYHRVIFAHGYFASALHEVAHWCIAGPRRRKRVDYGYWYKPDGRNTEEQRAFERVEVKPQALEWLFSDACGFPFRFSADNLDGEAGDLRAFQEAVRLQREAYLREGLPKRARQFSQRLHGLTVNAPRIG